MAGKKAAWQNDPSLVAWLAAQRESRLYDWASTRATGASNLREHVRIEQRMTEGGYRRRQLLELLQNAVDAAHEHRRSRIAVFTTEDHLYVANEGEPLSKSGIETLLTSHDSSKRGSIGKFGLGFKSLLGISEIIEIFSRNISIVFDRERSEQLVRERDHDYERHPIPVMRLAWEISLAEHETGDPVLHDLARRHDTVIRLRLRDDEARQALAEELKALEYEFLLFARKDITLACCGRRAEVRKEEDGTRTLVVDGEEARWNVFERVVDLPETPDVKSDAGELNPRRALPITWAAPDDGRSAGNFWAFFPLQISSRIPGIVNAPFKTNDDRSSLAEGAFNQALLACCADLVVEALPTLRTRTSPARHLDFLPRQSGGVALSERFAQEIWSRARTAKLGPPGYGRLVVASELRTPPEVDSEIALGWQNIASSEERRRWVHVDACRDKDRRGRWMGLAAAKEAATIEQWVAAVARVEPDGAIAMLRWVAKLLAEDSNRRRFNGTGWAVVLDQHGRLRRGSELLFEGTDDEDRVHPRLLEDEGLRSVLRDLGVQGKDAGWYRNRLMLLRNSRQWEAYWTMWREAPADARTSSPDIHMKTVAGGWRLASELMTLGRLVGHEDISGLERSVASPLIVNSAEHGPEELSAQGVTAEPRWLRSWPWNIGLTFLDEWRAYAERKWYAARSRGRGRRPDTQDTLEYTAAGDLLRYDDWCARMRVTAALQSHVATTVRFGFLKDSIEVSSVISHALMTHGRFGYFSFDIWWICRSQPLLIRAFFGSTDDGFVSGIVADDLEFGEARTRDAKNALRELLEPDVLAGSDPEELLALYSCAARIGALPTILISRGQNVPTTAASVTSDEIDAPGVLVVTAEDLPFFENEGVRRWQPDAPPSGEALFGAPMEATELFPWMDGLLREGADARVVESLVARENVWQPWVRANEDGARMEIWRPNRTLPQRIDILHAAHRLDWLSLSVAEAEAVLVKADAARAAALADSSGTIEERLLRLVGPDVLWGLTLFAHADRSDVDDLSVARVFLAEHGCLALRVLRDELAAQGFNPPWRWGTDAAREFAVSLGLPPEFASSANRRRDPQEIVEGPPPPSALHDFQEEAVRALRAVVASSGDRAMLSLPTGAGKTRVMVETLVAETLRRPDRGRYVLWIAQQDELCEQAVGTFKRIWRQGGTPESLTIHRVWAGNRPKRAEGPQVVVATIQTFVRLGDDPRYRWLCSPTVVVVDEAHHAIAPSYTQLLRVLATEVPKRRMPFVGLSATPHRRDGLSEESLRLAKRFDDRLIPSMEKQWALQEALEERGILARADHLVLELPSDEQLTDAEREHVKTYCEFPPSVLERLARDKERNEVILDRVEGHLGEVRDGRVLLFSASVNHAHLLAAELALRGIRSASVDGGTPSALRRYFLREFATGEIRVMVNCGVLTTGFDEPKVTAVVVARPTLSPVLYQQMIGRGLRGPANGGTASCEIITVADNFQRFGLKVSVEWFEQCWGSARRVPVSRQANA